MSNPADLNTVPQPNTDKNYFNFKATGLKIDQTYAIKLPTLDVTYNPYLA